MPFSPTSIRLVLSSSFLALGMAAGGPALAQAESTVTAEQAAPYDGGIQDIVVTAQRRAQNLQDVPVSVTALTASVLEDSGVASVENLPMMVPGLVMTRQSRGAQPYIRGVGSQNTVPGNENAVATYVDGVYYSDPGASLFSFNNIERIEVLKGPQGTLFGRNATGGLINVVTQDPTVDPQLRASLSYGNYDTVEGNLYVSGGSGNIAADLAVYGVHQGDGFGRYLYVDGHPDANRRREIALRSKIKWTPSEDDTFILVADYRNMTGDIGTSRTVYPGAILAGGTPFRGSIHDATGTVVTDVPHSADYGVSLNYRRNLGEIDLSILSAYRSNEVRMIYDQDVGPLFLSHLDQSQDNRTFQTEVLLNGQAGALNWTAGIFYFQARARFNPIRFGSGTPAGNSDLFSTQQTHSYAAFAQGTLALGPSTNVTAGFRYTVDEREFYAKRFSVEPNPIPAGTIIQTSVQQRTFKEPTWRLGIDQKLSDRVMVYVSYNRGFKSGVFNLANPAAPPVNPEKLDAFEVGLKSELFDRLLRLNVSAFHYKYKDIHLNTVQAGITSLFNAARGEINGGEVEVVFAPRLGTGTLEVMGNLSILDAKYTRFPDGPITTPNPAGGNFTSLGDLAGNKMIRSPDWTTNFSVSYNLPVSFGEIGFNANYYHSDGFYWEADNRTRQDAYDVLNGSLSLRFGRDNDYRVWVFGNNLTNEKYYTGVAENSFGDTSSAAPPRTYGVGFEVRF